MTLAGTAVLGGTLAYAWQAPSPTLIAIVAAIACGIIAWRWKRGDFYKAVAEEKTAEVERAATREKDLRDEVDRLRAATDITPILRSLEGVSHALERQTAALERHAEMADKVVAKVGEMNGSLRSHSVAMEALATRLVLDESARALLEAAASNLGGRGTDGS